MAIYRHIDEKEYKELEARIVYEDNHLLVINKKSGEIVQGDKTGDEPINETYKAFVAQRDAKPGQVFMGVPHRLDRPVSGLVILAKTSKALERLTAMFRDGNVHKTYWALTCTAPALETAVLQDWLWKNESQNKSYIVSFNSPGTDAPLNAPKKNAKLAKLKYKKIANTDRYFLLEVELLTGRHHQIRCQLANMKCVIKGDLKYGAPRSNPDGGICLHSRFVSFIHPVKKIEIKLEAPLPSSWPQIAKATDK